MTGTAWVIRHTRRPQYVAGAHTLSWALTDAVRFPSRAEAERELAAMDFPSLFRVEPTTREG